MPRRPRRAAAFLRAWAPYLLLVVFVLLWGYAPVQKWLDHFTLLIHWPGLPPKAAPFKLNWLSASGTACLLAALLGAVIVRALARRNSCAWSCTRSSNWRWRN